MFWFKTKDGDYINLQRVQIVGASASLKDCLVLTGSNGDRTALQDPDDIARLRKILDEIAEVCEADMRGR